MEDLLKQIGITPKKEWKILMVHDGWVDVHKISSLCEAMGIEARNEYITDGMREFEILDVFTTDLGYKELLVKLIFTNLI